MTESSEAAAQRVDDAIRTKDTEALREAIEDDTDLGSLAVLRCAETGWIEGFKAAVEAGANFRCKTESGATPAHLAAMGGHDALDVILALDPGSANAVNGAKQTPLHFAAVGGNEFAVSALIRHDADVHATTSDGSTALHYACGKCTLRSGPESESKRPLDRWERCLNVLLGNGADPFACDLRGKAPGDRLPSDARAKPMLDEFMRQKEAAAEAAARDLCAEPAPAPKRKARRRKAKPRAASPPVVAASSDSDSETSGAAVAARPVAASSAAVAEGPAAAASAASKREADAPPPAPARARAASLADDSTPWSTVVRRRGTAPPEPAEPRSPPHVPPPRDVDELFAALFPAAPALALRAEHLLRPSDDLSPSQLEAVHDILDACTRRVIDARIAVAARTRSESAAVSA